jgi:hypothetical protein
MIIDNPLLVLMASLFTIIYSACTYPGNLATTVLRKKRTARVSGMHGPFMTASKKPMGIKTVVLFYMTVPLTRRMAGSCGLRPS